MLCVLVSLEKLAVNSKIPIHEMNKSSEQYKQMSLTKAACVHVKECGWGLECYQNS